MDLGWSRYYLQVTATIFSSNWLPLIYNQGVPRNPFGSYVSDLLNVEKSMNLRRKRLHFVLSKSQIAPSVSTFPLLGVRLNNSTTVLRGAIANSEYISDDLINPHPRFGALTQNIRQRRGSNVNISVMGIDQQTIHMDAMAFGMGCCCLQVTSWAKKVPFWNHLQWLLQWTLVTGYNAVSQRWRV